MGLGLGGVPQKGNEQSNKKGKKNRSVKVHGREVKQFPFERETKEYRGATVQPGPLDEREGDRGTTM